MVLIEQVAYDQHRILWVVRVSAQQCDGIGTSPGKYGLGDNHVLRRCELEMADIKTDHTRFGKRGSNEGESVGSPDVHDIAFAKVDVRVVDPHVLCIRYVERRWTVLGTELTCRGMLTLVDRQ